jgi:protein TonB
MASYRDPPTRAERARAIAAVVAVHGALAALFLTGSNVAQRAAEQPSTQMVDVPLPPPPPEPPPPRKAAKAAREAGAEGKKAEPAPVVAAPARVPTANPLPAAPVAGTGSATTAGAGATGTGPGAGGTGSGSGGGGSGGGGGIGEDAQLLSGGLSRRDYRRLRAFAAPAGRAVLALLVGPDGRVAQCSIRQTSGVAALDAELCAILQPRMRWAPARDRAGRPLSVGIIYTAIWSRD